MDAFPYRADAVSVQTNLMAADPGIAAVYDRRSDLWLATTTAGKSVDAHVGHA